MVKSNPWLESAMNRIGVTAVSPTTPFRMVNRGELMTPSGSVLKVEQVMEAAVRVNKRLATLSLRTEAMALNIFEVLDFRMLSGMIGELLAVELARMEIGFAKNPNIDGYPDLLPVLTKSQRRDFDEWKAGSIDQFIAYPYGGFEIKNTFGTKKSGANLPPGVPRAGKINAKLDWKAHHQNTNSLIGILSDYVGRTPQIAAVMFSNNLGTTDWAEKQNPTANSTMTSFSVIGKTGWAKMHAGLRFCLDTPAHLEFLSVGGGS